MAPATVAAAAAAVFFSRPSFIMTEGRQGMIAIGVFQKCREKYLFHHRRCIYVLRWRARNVKHTKRNNSKHPRMISHMNDNEKNPPNKWRSISREFVLDVRAVARARTHILTQELFCICIHCQVFYWQSVKWSMDAEKCARQEKHSTKRMRERREERKRKKGSK